MRTKKVPRVEPGKAYEVGLGRPTFIDDCHALPVSWITGYRLVDRQSVRREVPPCHDRVAADYPPGGDGSAKDPVRAVRFSDDEQPGGLLVQAMDHSSPLGITLGGQPAAPAQQGVHEGPGPIARRRMHHHTRRLVHHQQRLVFVDDADWNVFARDRPLLQPGDLDADDFARFGPVARLFAPSVDVHVSLRDQRGRLRTRELGTLGNKEIEADIAVRLDGKLSGIAQSLDLRLRIRYGGGRNDWRGGSLLAPQNPRQEKGANAHGHIGNVEGRPP